MGDESTVPTSGVRILVGTPCSQVGVSTSYLHSMTELRDRCVELGWDLDIRTREDALVTRTRNIFASQVAREDTYTHLLMVDADIGFEPGVVERLVTSEHPVVGACVPLREVRWQTVQRAVRDIPELTPTELESIAHGHAVGFPRRADGTGVTTLVDDFIPARFLGSAMLLARREVLVDLAASDQVTHYDHGGPYSDWKPDGWTFFDPLVDPEGGLYLSEDYAFCLRWRSIGGTVWADVRSRVTHTGNVAVTGDVALTVRTATRLTNSGRPSD